MGHHRSVERRQPWPDMLRLAGLLESAIHRRFGPIPVIGACGREQPIWAENCLSASGDRHAMLFAYGQPSRTKIKNNVKNGTMRRRGERTLLSPNDLGSLESASSKIADQGVRYPGTGS